VNWSLNLKEEKYCEYCEEYFNLRGMNRQSQNGLGPLEHWDRGF